MGKQRNDDEDKAFNGLVPWSMEEFNWVTAQFIKSKRKGDRRPSHVILGEIFLKRYDNRLQFMAHFYRHRMIIDFLDEYKEQLVKDGFSGDDGGGIGFIQALLESLCALPFSEVKTDKDGDKNRDFSYKEVKAATLKKINAHLN